MDWLCFGQFYVQKVERKGSVRQTHLCNTLFQSRDNLFTAQPKRQWLPPFVWGVKHFPLFAISLFWWARCCVVDCHNLQFFWVAFAICRHRMYITNKINKRVNDHAVVGVVKQHRSVNSQGTRVQQQPTNEVKQLSIASQQTTDLQRRRFRLARTWLAVLPLTNIWLSSWHTRRNNAPTRIVARPTW